MKGIRGLAAIAATGVVTLLGASAAIAADPTFTVFFDPAKTSVSSNTPPTGVTGEATFSFIGTGSNSVAMVMNLSNTTPAPIKSKFVGIGFQLPTEVTYLSYTPSSNFDAVVTNGSLPPFGSFDICVTTAKPTCLVGGSPNSGLSSGESAIPAGTFSLSSTTLDGAQAFRDAFAGMFVTNTYNPFVARFKAIEGGKGGSDKLTGVICEGDDCIGPPPAPGDEVPGPLPLLGAAAAFGYSRKIRRRIKSNILSE